MPKILACFVALLMLATACRGDDSNASDIDLSEEVGSEVVADTTVPSDEDEDDSDDETDEETGGDATISVNGTDQPTSGEASSDDPDGDSNADTGDAMGDDSGDDSGDSSDRTTTSQQASGQPGNGQPGNGQSATDSTTNPTTNPTTGSTTNSATNPTAARPGATATVPTPTTAVAPSTTSQTTRPAPVAANLTWGLDATQPQQSWTKPSLNQTYRDPAYRTQLRRVTSANGTRFDRNTYSRRQAENANGTMFMTYHGNADYHVYSVDSTNLVRALTIDADSEPQWHPSNPSKIRHLTGANSYSGSLTLQETDVNTGRQTTIADFEDQLKAAIPSAAYVKDRAEGSPSRDGNRWAWIVYDDNEDVQGIVSYDLATNTVLGTTTNLISKNLDWVSMSPTGRYVLAGFWEGTYIYDADMTNRRQVTGASEHSDIALGRNGRDTYVYIDFHGPSPTAGWLTAVDLGTLERTRIFDLYNDANTSLHISGKGYDKPGWVVVSSYNCKDRGAWSCEKVMAVEIASGGRVLNLAHTYNCGDDYWTETHAVVNRRFDAVYFNSDGGSCGIDAEVYRLDIPAFD